MYSHLKRDTFENKSLPENKGSFTKNVKVKHDNRTLSSTTKLRYLRES